jgi:large repetitive protein
MVQAVNFAVRDSAGGLVRGAVGGDTGSNFIQMGSGDEISLNLAQSSVVAYERVGGDLMITLADGGTIKLAGFFAGAEENLLYLSTNGEVIAVDLSGGEGTLFATYGTTDSWDKYSVLDDLRFVDGDDFASAVVVSDEPAGQGLFLPGLLGGGLGAGGIAAGVVGGGLIVGGGGGGGGGSGRPLPTVDDPNRTETITSNTTDKDRDITGTGVAGDTVVVTIGTQTQTTTIRDDGTWGVTFPGTNLPPDGNYDADVVVTPPGGTPILLDGPNYIIDVTPPPVTLTQGFESNGDVENLAEHANGVTLSGTSEAGATVSVLVNGVTKTVTVGSNGAWSVNYTTTELPGGEYIQNAVIRATDPLGNVTVVNDRVVVDTIPNVITFDAVTADNTVNNAENTAGFTISGMGTANATISMTLQGITRTVTVGGDGKWSLNWAAGVLTGGEYDATINATSTDAAGNVRTATHTMRVDTTTSVVFATTPVETDNTVNATERADGVTLTGTTQAGNTVSVAWNGQTLAATVAANGSWSVTFPASGIPSSLLPTATIATVTARDAAGNTATDTRTINIDTATDVAINSTQVGDNIVSGAEAAGGFTLTGTAEAGARVSVSFDGGTAKVVTANASGVWSASWAAGEIRTGEYNATVSVTATDLAGNTDTASGTLRVDTVAPGAPDVTSLIRDTQGLRGVGVTTSDDDLTFFTVNSNGVSSALAATETPNPSFNETNYNFASRVPDGTYLVVNTEDVAGNESSTLFIVSNTTATTVDLTRAGLQNFDFSTIDLNFAPDARLTITEAQLTAITGPDKRLVISGDADDQVTMTGAVDSGANVSLNGQTYSVYTLGNQGATVLLDDDIQRVI